MTRIGRLSGLSNGKSKLKQADSLGFQIGIKIGNFRAFQP